jgi:hypothetical protein
MMKGQKMKRQTVANEDRERRVSAPQNVPTLEDILDEQWKSGGLLPRSQDKKEYGSYPTPKQSKE